MEIEKGMFDDNKIIKRKKLYGFDNGKEHKFIKFEFTNSDNEAN